MDSLPATLTDAALAHLCIGGAMYPLLQRWRRAAVGLLGVGFLLLGFAAGAEAVRESSATLLASPAICFYCAWLALRALPRNPVGVSKASSNTADLAPQPAANGIVIASPRGNVETADVSGQLPSG